MRALYTLICAVMLLLSGGCTIRREWDVDTLDPERLLLLNDAATKAEVLERVGPPHSVGIQLGGSVFVYRARTESVENVNLSAFQASFDYQTTDRRTARLIVLFDKKGQKIGQGFDNALDPEQEESGED